jgi:hypothetical protein
MPKATALSSRGEPSPVFRSLPGFPLQLRPSARLLPRGESILYLLVKQKIFLLAHAKYPSIFKRIASEVKL